LSKKPTSKAVTCVRLIRDTTPSLYALPTDGRKYKEQQAKRRALAMQLATFADGDGTRVRPSADRLHKALGWQRDTLFRYLNDLKRLGFLKDEEESRTGSHGTKKRRLDLDAISRKSESEVGDSRSTKLAESESEVGKPESDIENSESEVESSQSEVGASESEIAPYSTDTRTVTQTGTHTHTQPKGESASVCVCEDLSTIDEESEMGALLKAFLKENDGEPGSITGKQREQLKELLRRHGRENFRTAARAWMKDHPWDSRTTNPFSRFISGFEGYAAKKSYDVSEKTRLEKQNEDLAAATEFHHRKCLVGYETRLHPEFLATLPQEDRDYIKQVAAAKGFQDMPPNNGRNYFLEDMEFWQRRDDEAAKEFADNEF